MANALTAGRPLLGGGDQGSDDRGFSQEADQGARNKKVGCIANELFAILGHR